MSWFNGLRVQNEWVCWGRRTHRPPRERRCKQYSLSRESMFLSTMDFPYDKRIAVNFIITYRDVFWNRANVTTPA